jgi:hypothetical protein
MKIRMVEIQPPPNFHAAAPASIPLNGPCIHILLPNIEIASRSSRQN